MVRQDRAMPGRLALLVGLALMLMLGVYGLAPSRGTVFAVSASTDVLEVRPGCGEKLVWDLPGGRVEPRSGVSPDDEVACSGWNEDCHVTVTLLAGASARIELHGPQRFGIAFGQSEAPACPDPVSPPIVVSTASGTLPADPRGYFYPSDQPFGELAADVQRFAIPLAGEVTVGQDLQFGGGWQVATPLLRSGTIHGRDQAFWTRERITVLAEDIDPGSVVQTHAAAGDTSAADGQARGFVRFFDDHLDVQLYRNRSIAVHSYLGAWQRLEVPRWRVWWHSPALQTAASALVFTLGMVGFVFSYYQSREVMRDSRFFGWLFPARPAASSDRPPAPDRAEPTATGVDER